MMCSNSDGSVTICVIHKLELLPKMDLGIFVMIELGLTVITEVADAEREVSVNDGAVKDFGCQSSKKNPIVFARGGSMAGCITTVVSPGEGGSVSTAPFLQLVIVMIALINSRYFLPVILLM